VLGFDLHLFQLTLPPLPPIPVGIFPYPFLGQIKAGKAVPAVRVNGEHAAHGEITVHSTISHAGPLCFLPILSIVDGACRPSITLEPSAATKVFVQGKPLLTWGNEGHRSCGQMKEPFIISASGSVSVGG